MNFKRESKEERFARIAKMREEQRADFLNSPQIKQLKASGHLARALELLSSRKRKAPNKWTAPAAPLDLWIFNAVKQSLAEPELAETMTGKARREHAAAIEHHCESLWKLLEPFSKEQANFPGMTWPFQPHLDYLALELSIDYTRNFELPSDEMKEVQHRSRYAMYYLLTQRLEDVLATLVQGATHFAELETIIKKPNDPNARRLYFLRKVTGMLVSEFGSPCRGVALALASAYFDCSDLDEASISKLAPVRKPVPIEIPLASLETMVAMGEAQLAKQTDPESVEELTDHLNFLREMIAKRSA